MYMKEFYTVDELAEKLRVTPFTIRRAIRAGRIQAFRPGMGKKSAYRIPATEIDRIMVMSFEETMKNLKGLKNGKN